MIFDLPCAAIIAFERHYAFICSEVKNRCHRNALLNLFASGETLLHRQYPRQPRIKKVLRKSGAARLVNNSGFSLSVRFVTIAETPTAFAFRASSEQLFRAKIRGFFRQPDQV